MKLKKIYVLMGSLGILIALGIGGYVVYQVVAPPQTPSVPGFSQNNLPEGDRLQETPLPEVQQVIMAVPPPDASPAAFQQYRANIEFNAVASDTVTITDCKPSPMVLKVVQGSTFKLENRDIKEHTIVVNTDHSYTLNPKETVDVTADFGSGLGIYTYSCDDPALPVGVFLVRSDL